MRVLTSVLFPPTGARGILMTQSVSLPFWPCHAYFPPHTEESAEASPFSRALWSPTDFITLQPLWMLRCSSEEQISLPIQAPCPHSPPGSFHGWFPPFVKASNQISHSQRGTILESNIPVTLYPFILLYFPYYSCHYLTFGLSIATQQNVPDLVV